MPLVPQTGMCQAYLARITVELPHVDRDKEESQPLCGTLKEFKDANRDNQALLSQLNNKVKVCPNCGKGNGFTLAECNSCGTHLAATPVTFTDNVFMGFVYGVGQGKFPYKISIRRQTPNFLCFDDPLTLSPLHLNIIPTDAYCPDCRYLFANPAKGLKMLADLFECGKEAALQHFWNDEQFRKRYFKDASLPKTEEMYDIVCAGMNFPPSMNQLHLQFIHPPLLPMHFSMAMEGIHFSHKRFFPLKYLKKALSLGSKARLDIRDDTPIEDIIEHFNKLGVNYDEYHSSMVRGVKASQQKYAAWNSDEFELLVINGKPFNATTMAPADDLDAKAEQKIDEKKIQNYGRPYVDDKPTGTYYKFAKKAGDVTPFVGKSSGGALGKLAASACSVCSPY